MEYCYYELTTAPDFSLYKYSTLSETGPAGVLVQHRAFWRQINQWGKQFGGVIRFIYEYNPERSKGQQLKLVLRFDAPNQQARESISQIMKASVLAPYYPQMNEADDSALSKTIYAWKADLFKQERFIESSFNENKRFYTVSEWTTNQDARLYSAMKMMEVMKSHCAYCVNIYPVDYCDRLEKGLEYILPHLRELNSFKVKTGSNSVSSGGRDENAKRALDYYEDLEEQIANSPHFLLNITAFGQSESGTKQLLDAAASEAITTGNHSSYGEKFGNNIFAALSEGFTSWSDPAAEDTLLFLPHLFTLDEMVPYAVFPVLFPGENIEMPKETVPPPQGGMLIGTDEIGHEIYFPWKKLNKHAFLAGMPGSGKTNTMMYLVSEIYKSGIPVLVMEPAKKEYRVLSTLPGMEKISLFSPCSNSMFPIHLNPFEFPKRMKLADHINRLLDVFNGTFQLDPPMPMLLTEGIQNCYEELGWLPGMINIGELEYPTMSMLYSNIEKLLDKYKYAPEVKSNLQSILQVRIGSLLAREMGDIFDVKESTYGPEEWLSKSAIIELASLGTGPSNFLMLMLMTLIRETLDVQVYHPDEYGKPRHMIFLEEAHNLIANTSVQQPGSLDPKISATAFVTKMLAEVRALGEGIIIADQLPTAMAPEVVKNTSLKIGLRLTSQDERELLGSTMSADAVQMEKMGIFTPGYGLVSYEDLLKPFEMQIPEFKNDDSIDDNKILGEVLYNPNYHYNMQRSAVIIGKKYWEKHDSLKESTQRLFDNIPKIHSSWKENYELIEEETVRMERDSNYRASANATKIIAEKRDIQSQYDSLMDDWCKLTLEVLLYMGVTAVRRRKADTGNAISEEAKKTTIAAHNKWLDQIKPLYKRIRESRGDARTLAIKHSLKVNDQLENRLINQQKMIQKSWDQFI